MVRVVVRHHQEIAPSIEGQREGLEAIGTYSTEAAIDALPGADVFVVNTTCWDDALVEAFDSLEWLQATSAGYSAFPLDELEARNITLTNAAGNYGPPVGDHAMALLLGLARKLPACSDQQRRGKWDRSLGSELLDLEGRTLTVVGLGDIGDAIAKRAEAFDMEVRGTKRDPSSYDGVLSFEQVYASDALPELLSETDVLVLAVPLTDETHHLIDADALSTVPDSALLINIARGAVVDEAALVDALDAGELAGAGLDVFEAEPLPEESPLWDRDDVILTPHLAGLSTSFVPRFVDLFLENYDRWQAGDPLKNRIL